MTKLATICYIDNGEAFLMLHRDKKENDIHQDKWVSVGGKFEPGESPRECAVREIQEETGLIATDCQLVGFITFPNFQHDEEDWYSFVYRVRGFEGEVRSDCPEGTLAWIPYGELMDLPTWEGDYHFLEWILNEQPFFTAKFVYDLAGNLTDYDVSFEELTKGESHADV